MQINMHEAKTHLSRFVDRAAQGEEIVIARAGKPLAKLVCIEVKSKPQRVPGLSKGTFTIAPDAFAPMSEEELALWYK